MPHTAIAGPTPLSGSAVSLARDTQGNSRGHFPLHAAIS